MNLSERRLFLINELLKEQGLSKKVKIPMGCDDQKLLLRALFNVRLPNALDKEFLKVQDEYFDERSREKGILDYKKFQKVDDDIYLFKGDITRIKCDAIVNAANNQLLGCFCPNHSCIDNQIHTFAGARLRLECNEIMQKQGFSEPNGKAKITKAYSLPCKFILHTVGPIVSGAVKKQDEISLENCYKSCLKLADENGVKSIAFCCISTGEFHFPNELAAKIAIKKVKEYKNQTKSKIEVIFNVFKDVDYEIYRKLFEKN